MSKSDFWHSRHRTDFFIASRVEAIDIFVIFAIGTNKIY